MDLVIERRANSVYLEILASEPADREVALARACGDVALYRDCVGVW